MSGIAVRAVVATTVSAPSRVALVQGASRGIGFEYVRQLLSRPDYTVFAACRGAPETVTGLTELTKRHPGRCIPVQMDCTDEASINRAYAEVKNRTPYLNLLINVAGLLHNPEGLKPEKAYRDLSAANLVQSMSVNAIGPALVMQHFMELLIQAEIHGAATPLKPAIVANMSARVSSIGDNSLGGWYAYRASKCALNQLTKCFSIELANKKRKIACLLLHPGTVDTDMSYPFQRNVAPEKLFSRERAVEQLLKIIDSADLSSNGRFYAWDGTEVPW